MKSDMPKEADIRLRIIARKGHYDLLSPRDESISVHMDLPDGQYINLDFDVDDQMVDYIDDPHTWTDTAVQLIDKWAKRWISPEKPKVLAFKEFILAHQKEIDVARLKEVIEEKRAQMIRLNEDIGNLESDVMELLQKDLTTILMEAVKVDAQ